MVSNIFRRPCLCALAAGLAAASLAACTSMGSGTGRLEPGATPIHFEWISEDGGLTGVMSARTGTDASFTGPFMRIARGQASQPMTPPLDDSLLELDDWDSWSTPPGTGPDGEYTAKVLARLASADGRRMSCHFILNSPVAGMWGGGHGQCELAEGHTVDASFDPDVTMAFYPVRAAAASTR